MKYSLQLRVKLPWGEERIIPLRNAKLVIGRDPDCEIEINDPEVSRRHALLDCTVPERIIVSDLDSTNGTYMLGHLIDSETSFQPGTSMKVGETLITLESQFDNAIESIDISADSLVFQDWYPLKEENDQLPNETIHHVLLAVQNIMTEVLSEGNLNRLLNLIASTINAENGMIIISDNGEWLSKSIRLVRNERVIVPMNIIEKITVDANPALLNSDQKGIYKKLKQCGVGSAVCAPIRDEDRTWGAIYLDRSLEKAPFEISDLNFLCNVVHLFALSISSNQFSRYISTERNGLRREWERWNRLTLHQDDVPVKSLNRNFQRLLFKVMRLANSNCAVMLFGPRGAGCTFLAQRIHTESNRKLNSFIAVDCETIPPYLMEEEFFGLESSEAITTPGKRGFLEMANSGTLYLQEISAIPVHIQKQLANAVKEKKIHRKGSKTSIPLDVRLILSTDVDIPKMQKAGTLSTSLFELFEPAILEIPSLKQRPEDIQPLAKYFLRHFLPKNRPVPEFSDEVTSILELYDWPGNIRELAHVMLFIASVCDDLQVEIGDLPRNVREKSSPSFDSREPLRKQLDHLEGEIIRTALERNNHIVTRAASELGLSESTLRYRMHRLGLTVTKDRE
ncbi:sigma 54-interacting transcriptional regulator [bacterium]|nr:sigma 54-interacting transcriptional regulator [candidate division CSSED10-310 bacterium]